MWVEWKYWDVALAGCGFAIQCGLAWLGLTLTHWKNKAWFFGLVSLGFLMTVVAVKRGVDTTTAAGAQLTDIQQQVRLQHTHAAFLTPIPIKGFRDWPYRVGDFPTLGVAFRNGGSYRLRNSDLQAALAVRPKNDMTKDSTFDDVLKDAKFLPPGGDLMPFIPEYSHITVHGPPLSKGQVEGLERRELGIFVAARLKWRDDSGCYMTEMYYVEVAETPAPAANWHIGGPQNGDESKIDCEN